MTVAFHPEAEAEFLEAVARYEEARPGLGDEFIQAVEHAVARIVEHPRAWAAVDGEVRRCLVARFPYGVLYAEEDERILVLAVMSLHREPGYWRTRVAGIQPRPH